MTMIDWGVVFGIGGILATFGVSLSIFLKQRKDGNKLQEVVDSIDILTQQENNRRERHIHWLTHHSVNVLEDARNDLIELRELLNNFRGNQTEQNLNALQVRAITLSEHLNRYTIPFISENIRNAFDYINNPWLTNHFLYELSIFIPRPCLSITQSQLFVGMTNFQGLQELVDLIDDAITRIDRYITTIQEEQG